MTGRPSVTVVMVTYGDRASLCLSALEAALSNGAKSAVVVVNGSSGGSRLRLRSFASTASSTVRLVEFATNRGSAEAFARGMAEAAHRGLSEFLWLLDDDNAPASDCLEKLLAAHMQVSGAEGALVFARRESSPLHRRVLAAGASAFPPPGSFMYFDVRDRLSQARQSNQVPPVGPVAIPYGPYGGLLLSTEICNRIGPPRADYVLYEDDTEYTARAAEQGARLFLCLDAVIIDMEENWLARDGLSGPARLLGTPHEGRAKVYYSTRNRVHFERARAAQHGAELRFFVNGLVYTAFLILNCVRARRLGQLPLMLKAMLRGLNGRMGVESRLELYSGESKFVHADVDAIGRD